MIVNTPFRFEMERGIFVTKDGKTQKIYGIIKKYM